MLRTLVSIPTSRILRILAGPLKMRPQEVFCSCEVRDGSCYQHDHQQSSSSSSDAGDHASSEAMPRQNVYGKKKAVPRPAAIFHGPASPTIPIKFPAKELVNDDIVALSNTIAGLHINSHDSVVRHPHTESLASPPQFASPGSPLQTPAPLQHGKTGSPLRRSPRRRPAKEPVNEAAAVKERTAWNEVKPIIDAILLDSRPNLSIQEWSDVLLPGVKLEKIAEASFAEVYRVQTKKESSIIKILNLRVSGDKASMHRDHANLPSAVVSELRIMNALTPIPGFVRFADAHVVQGAVPLIVKKAWKKYAVAKEGTHHQTDKTDPDDYCGDSMFLVMELGNAGTCLEDLKVESVHQIWDVLIGTTMALARAEFSHQFEHRDLHENNICYLTEDLDAERLSLLPSKAKFGRSGIVVTIIDYGLSRATLKRGEVIFNDLEQDLNLFHYTGTNKCEKLQFDNYRLMRNHLFTGSFEKTTKAWHTAEKRTAQGNVRSSWRKSIPFTNVIWINYIFTWLKHQYSTNAKDAAGKASMKDLERDTAKFKLRLTPGSEGGFQNAHDALVFMIEEGWIADEQVYDNDEGDSTLWDDSIHDALDGDDEPRGRRPTRG